MRKLVTIGPAVVLSLALGAAACTNTANDSAAARVEKALDEAKVEGVNVDYDENGRVVHLKGKVESAEQKERAEQIAATAVGTTGTVLNELEVEGMGDDSRLETADDQLKTRLSDAIQAHPELSEQPIDFYVNNGAVTVTGEVKSAAQKAEVGRIVKETPGVEDVANELLVAGAKNRQGQKAPRR
jgi:osmotically-inducible protein OsmY